MQPSATVEQMAERLARLEAVQAAVLDIGRSAASLGDLGEFYRNVHAAVARFMAAHSFYIALLDLQRSGVRYAYRVDEKDACPDPDTLFELQSEDQSPTAWVIRRGESLCFTMDEIAERNAGNRRWGEGAPAEHWLGMPLIGHDGTTFGALVTQSYAPGFRYSAEDIALFQLFSGHVADAVERAQFAARLEHAINERTRSLEIEIAERRRGEKLQRTLYEISAQSVREIDLDTFYTRVHALLGALLYARNLLIALLDDTGEAVQFAYDVDEKDPSLPIGYRRPASHGSTGFVLRTRRPQRIDQARYRALVTAGDIYQSMGSPDFNVWIGAPLIYQEKLLGAIILQSYDPAIGYGERDLELLTFVADHIAAALSRKRANDELATQHRELQRTLEDLQVAQTDLMRQEKLASLGALVAGIAHEVNTPLGICVTAVSHLAEETQQAQRAFNAETLTRDALHEHFQAADEVLRILTANTQRASALIRSFKQVAVDQSSDDVREIALAEYIEETLKSLRPKLKGTRHTIEVQCDPLLRVRSVPGALSQILTNLVINSIMHGFEHLDGGCIAIDVSCDESFLLIDYRDDGSGMTSETLRHLFDPFYTTKRGQGGSGLGANIIYNLVTAKLGGSIAVDSAPGTGLHYRIMLPLEPSRFAPVAPDG